MLIFKGYQENKEKLPIVVPSSGEGNDIFPVDFYVNDAEFVFYIIKDNSNINVYSHNNIYSAKDQELFRGRCETYCSSLKNGEYLIDFEPTILKNSKIPKILFRKVKNVTQYNKEDWSYTPNTALKEFVLRGTIDNKFYIIHGGHNENAIKLLFAQEMARHQCLGFTSNTKPQTIFGKVLTLLLTTQVYKTELDMPSYLDDVFKISSLFKFSLKDENLNKIKELNKIDDEENRVYLQDKNGQKTDCYAEIKDIEFSNKDTLFSSFLNMDDQYTYFQNTFEDFPVKVVNDMEFNPAIEISDIWQIDYNSIIIKLLNPTQADKVLLTTFFEEVIVEFFDEVTDLKKASLFKNTITNVLKDKVEEQTTLVSRKFDDDIYSEYFGRMM